MLLKGRVWEWSKLGFKHGRRSPDYAAIIYFPQKCLFMVRQQVRHLLIHSGRSCHLSLLTLLQLLSSRTLCQPFSILHCYHSSLPALLHTASSHTHLTPQIGGDKNDILYTIRISGYYSSVPPGQPSSYVFLIVHLCGSIAKHRWDRKGDTLKYKTLLPHSGPTKNSTWLKSLQVFTYKLGQEVDKLWLKNVKFFDIVPEWGGEYKKFPVVPMVQNTEFILLCPLS